MKELTYKVKTKSPFEVQVKKGATIMDKAQKVSGGWYACCKIHNTLDDALECIRESLELMALSFCNDEFVVKFEY